MSTLIPTTEPEDINFNEMFRETPVASETLCEASFFNIERQKVALPNNKLATRDILHHPGAVGILAVDDQNRICMVHQWRAALGRATLEIPAGKIDANEYPLETAKRELVEETGIKAQDIAYLTTIAPACGYSDELIHIYLACGLTFGAATPDEDEFVAVDMVDVDQLVDMILDGQIEDAKTVSAVLMWDAVRRRLIS